jgi:hypothetical protein
MSTHDITIEQGASFSKTLTLKDDNNVVINVSADTFRGQVRKHHSSTDIQATFTFTITDGPNGVVTWSLTDTQTSAMSSGKLLYDIEWVQSSGTVTRILEGIVDSTPEITR